MHQASRDAKQIEITMFQNQTKLTEQLDRLESLDKILKVNSRELIDISKLAKEMKETKLDESLYIKDF